MNVSGLTNVLKHRTTLGSAVLFAVQEELSAFLLFPYLLNIFLIINYQMVSIFNFFSTLWYFFLA